MLIEPSPAVSLALDRAAASALLAGRPEVTPLDLLLGLLAEKEGQAASVLTAAGLSLERFFADPNLSPNPNLDQHGGPLEYSVSLACGRVLVRARDLARWHSAEGTVTTDQVLFALLDAEPELRSLLEAHGLDYARLTAAKPTEPPPLPLDQPLDLETPQASQQSARIVDAAGNRAREALRVLEDYARFALDDALLSGQLKDMRHELARCLAPWPGLIAARDTLHDVGTEVKAADEHQRGSLAEVVQANARRLQEALRSLEEIAKTSGPEEGGSGLEGISLALEKLRYRAYTLERALLMGQEARTRLAQARLYVLVTEALCRASLAGTVSEALAGGAEIIQLREKNLPDRVLLEKAKDLRRLTRAAGALFIVNDRPDIAVLSQADGVHLGQDDMPVHEARRLLGPDAIIGVSTHNLDQVRQGILEGASYLGVGPTFPSPTKDFSALAGVEFVRQAAAATSLPCFVLGGITLDNLAEVIAAGGRRVAVSGAVCAAEDPRLTVAKMKGMLTE